MPVSRHCSGSKMSVSSEMCACCLHFALPLYCRAMHVEMSFVRGSRGVAKLPVSGVDTKMDGFVCLHAASILPPVYLQSTQPSVAALKCCRFLLQCFQPLMLQCTEVGCWPRCCCSQQLHRLDCGLTALCTSLHSVPHSTGWTL